MVPCNVDTCGASEEQRSPATVPILTERFDNAEELLRSTLDALSAHVAVLDENGTIIAVNEAWRSFGAAAGSVGQEHGVRMNYLTVCARSAAASEEAGRTGRALREMMAGTRSSFRMEYACAG